MQPGPRLLLPLVPVSVSFVYIVLVVLCVSATYCAESWPKGRVGMIEGLIEGLINRSQGPAAAAGMQAGRNGSGGRVTHKRYMNKQPVDI